MKLLAIFFVVFCVVGPLMAAGAYMGTGVLQFGSDILDFEALHTFQPGKVGEVMAGFLSHRFLVGVLEAFLLFGLVRRGARAAWILALGTSLPVLCEVALAWPFPFYGMPAGLVLRVAAAYLAPALLTGLVL